MAVYEGKGRLEKLILDNAKTPLDILGYITTEKKTLNYWLPTRVIMVFLLFVYQAIEENDQDLFKSQMVVLKSMLRDSESGKKEFFERALSNKKEFREPILTAIGM